MNIKKIREDFPILNKKINGKPLVYLDNAATTQKPIHVLNVIDEYYRTKNANTHRGAHQLSEEATHSYEESRKKTKKFINAKHSEEVIFTRGTTESINLVANTMKFEKKDRILCTVMEHHSNMVPWLELKRKNVEIDFADIKNDGTLDMNDFESKLTKNTKLAALTHASNMLGTINDIEKIAKMCHEQDTLLLVDGAQSAPHMNIDVQKLDCDFFAFSGHKMLGPTGIGCLYAKKTLLEKMEPYQTGGGMIRVVNFEGATWAELPQKFEAGTPNIAGAVGLGAAIDYLNNIGMKSVRSHEQELTAYALKRLSENKHVKIFGPLNTEKRTGVVSFNVGDIHAHDIATILDSDGIAVRSGHHCAQPLHERLKLAASCRASFYLYNTQEEVDTLCTSIDKCVKIFNIR
jgi:cysteine desulfurase/selenocysteine lyase